MESNNQIYELFKRRESKFSDSSFLIVNIFLFLYTFMTVNYQFILFVEHKCITFTCSSFLNAGFCNSESQMTDTQS